MKYLSLTVTLVVLLFNSAHADDQQLVKGFDIKCESTEIDAAVSHATYFKTLQDKAKIFALKTCENMLDNPTGSINDVDVLLEGTDNLVNPSGGNFSFKSALFEDWQQSFDSNLFEGMESLAYDFSFYQPNLVTKVDDFKGLVTKTSDECADGDVPKCVFLLEYRSSTTEVTYQFHQNSEQSRKQVAACQQMGFHNCEQALEDLSRAIEPYHYFIKAGHTSNVVKTLNHLNGQWDKFTKNSRHQTFIDKWLTTEIYHDQFNGRDWAEPPNYQFFLLHPGIVLDHFSAADRGEQTEIGLAIEWLGINRWDGDLPMGISLTSVYSDRSSGKRVGHGLMFHIHNNFSIGVVNRGNNDNSIFMNLNLFNWSTQQQDKYQAYEDKFGQFRGN